MFNWVELNFSIGSHWNVVTGLHQLYFYRSLYFCIVIFHSFATALSSAKVWRCRSADISAAVVGGQSGETHCLQQSDEYHLEWAQLRIAEVWGSLATESVLTCSPSCTCVGSTVEAGSPASANSSQMTWPRDWGRGWWGTGRWGRQRRREAALFSVRPRIIWTEIKALWKGPGENYPRPRKIKPGLKRCVVMTVCCASCSVFNYERRWTGPVTWKSLPPCSWRGEPI